MPNTASVVFVWVEVLVRDAKAQAQTEAARAAIASFRR